jgi:hypothetical protein
MNSTLASELPTRLIQALFESDVATSGRPKLPSDGRQEAIAWLRRALVDYGALDRHISLLQRLYREPFTYPRPHPASWAKPEWRPPDGLSSYRHRDPLPDDRIVAVADDGAGALSNAELATILLNPVALLDLFRVLDELNPEAWVEALLEASDKPAEGEIFHEEELKATVGPDPARHSHTPIARGARPTPWRGIADWMGGHSSTIAASLVAALTAGLGLSTIVAIRSVEQASALRVELARVERDISHNALAINDGGGRGLIEFHGDHPERPANWEAIWNDTYMESASPAVNVDRLYRAAGNEVKTFIDGLKKRKLTDFEILTALRQSFGPHEK